MNFNELEGLFYSYLHLEKRIAAITLFDDAKAFEELDVKQRKNKSYYCQMVKMAVNGKSWKADITNFACETSAKVLGLDSFYEEEEGIDGWLESGLYASRDIAAREHFSVSPVQKRNVGIMVGPLGESKQDPSVVIVTCKPYQAMRLIQGYTFHFGYKNDLQMSGMCGVCFESTALPITNHEMTISLLCSGTRFVCKWPEEMMMVSFPYDMAEKILDGVIQTAQSCEPNAYKERIKHRLLHLHLPLEKPLNSKKAYFYRNSK